MRKGLVAGGQAVGHLIVVEDRLPAGGPSYKVYPLFSKHLPVYAFVHDLAKAQRDGRRLPAVKPKSRWRDAGLDRFKNGLVHGHVPGTSSRTVCQ